MPINLHMSIIFTTFAADFNLPKNAKKTIYIPFPVDLSAYLGR